MTGTRVLFDGEQVYTRILTAIEEAQASVVIEMYRFASDGIGWRFAHALARKAEEGLEVAVLYDSFGCLGTSQKLWDQLHEAGVLVLESNPLPWSLRRFLRRDHRKLFVVDGQTAFVGGLNIADCYAPLSWGGAHWRDTAVAVHGPIVRELGSLFLEAWRAQGGPPLRGLGEAASESQDGRCALLATGGGRRRRHVLKAYRSAFATAQERIYLTNPYFVPDRHTRRALRQARQRGVRVVILLAGQTDMQAVKLASRYLYDRMLRWGIEIYEWTERVLHAKTATVDGHWATVGSFNLDRISARFNLEANVGFEDAEVAAILDARFEADLERSERLDLKSWRSRPLFDRLLEWLCFRFRFLL